MRPLLIAIAALLASASASAAPPAAAAAPSPANQACLDCHTASKPEEPGVEPERFARSVHGDLSCTDCHAGYVAPGPHELAALTGDEAALAARYGMALRPRRDAQGRVSAPQVGKPLEMEPVSKAPRAFLACANCHGDVVDALKGSVHGKWLTAATPAVAGPTCADCHGSPHVVAKADGKTDAERQAAAVAHKRAVASRCEQCHGDDRFAEAAGLNREVAVMYHDSIHGRLVALGSNRAPGCSDCHGSHAIADKDAPGSPVAAANKAKTCGRCHAGANDTFAAVISHKPLFESSSPVPHVVHVAFSWLTTLTLLFFAFHVLVDFFYELRMRLSRRKEAHAGAEAHQEVVRFDLHQRIQHWLMLSGVILLGLTGWPLRGAGSPEAIESSRKFLAVFGGAHGAGIVHRVAAVLIMVSAVYHLVYLGTLAGKKRLPLSMLPTPKDALDMRDNLLFMLGMRKERPRFDRYMYLEKFDYWAVFWGIVMMVGTGFIFWFPVFFAKFLPHWVLTAAQIVHGEEATLALLFLFVVHFYNVHLKPSIFPMNWAWLTGTIPLHMQKEEHPLEYERTLARGGEKDRK